MKKALLTGVTGQDGSYLAELLLGDASKARTMLNWTPKISFEALVAEMVREDLKSAERDEVVKRHGYPAYDYHE